MKELPPHLPKGGSIAARGIKILPTGGLGGLSIVSPKWVLIYLMLILGLMACSSAPNNLSSIYAPPPIIPDADSILTNPISATDDWTAAEIEVLRSLWLGSLPAVPANSSNGVAADPRAAALGHQLFFDPRLSANQQISCATCHIPELHFTDGQPTAHGTRPNNRNTMSLLGVGYAPWLLWDGRKDSLWSQALEPIESPDEQGSTRLHAVHLMNRDEYRAAYEAIFGPLPDLSDTNRFPFSGGPLEHPPYRESWERMSDTDQQIATEIFVNVGKVIAAYERLLVPGPSRFDQYVQGVLIGDAALVADSLTADELAGLRLFIGPADCIRCHSGPLFTDQQFHNTGVPFAEGLPLDAGRLDGLVRFEADPFTCSSIYNDKPDAGCIQVEDTSSKITRYAFKTPSLRSVSETEPYMHRGQLISLEDVLFHYNQAPSAPLGTSELMPLDLSEAEIAQLLAFLQSLSAPPATPAELLVSPTQP